MFSDPDFKGSGSQILSSDTVFSPVKSKNGNNCGQIYANGAYFTTFHPMDSKSKESNSLKVFCSEFGVPKVLIHDGSMEMVGQRTEFRNQVTKDNIKEYS